MLSAIENSYTVESEDFDNVFAHWQQADDFLPWNCLFVLPVWLKTWWQNFGRDATLYLLGVRHEGRTIGIAPLQRRDDTVRFIGDKNVCDNLDFIVDPNNAADFFHRLITYLKRDGVKRLELEPVRRDSSVMTHLIAVAAETGCRYSYVDDERYYALNLPGSWDDYLRMLRGKERHEIRRKLRRLNEAGQINFRMIENADSVSEEMEIFLNLFKSNRSDKAEFMNDQMVSFFKELAASLNEARILRLFFLDLDQIPVAATICFDYRSTMYLYNNGYDNRFASLSVGLLAKILSIKESIQSGLQIYDFLKGAEGYKQRLGGQPYQLYRCVIELS
ncbi:MAG: GNAT family N-acetyltransferase [Desulfobacterales bacterium]|jgi:CelD/BcsL family acetyltransferase involved in cellulose biosynthesis